MMRNNYREDGFIWFDDQISELADLLLNVQGLAHTYRKKKNHRWIRKVGDNNDVISTSQVNCFYRRICEKAGIEFHGQLSLRHTFATRCIEAGVKPVVLKNWLGHTNIHITLDTYADVYSSLNSASMEQLEKYLEV